jgi:hypothetical protein
VTPNCTQAGTSQQTSGLFGAPNQTDTRITSDNTLQIHQFKKDFPLMHPVPEIVNPDLLII